jgi:Ca2+-binding RTX toxin-like protein
MVDNGKDAFNAGMGNDELTGGSGPDIFQCGPGNDKITDFSPSQKDWKTRDCEQF